MNRRDQKDHRRRRPALPQLSFRLRGILHGPHRPKHHGLIYDALMARFNEKLVKMQFQTEVINLGYKAATYFEKYPGRFISAHLSDWTADKKEVPIGQGVIGWTEFFAAAKTGGVKNFFVEMEFETYADSAKYIASL